MPRRPRDAASRAERRRPQRKLILVVCEGEQTEYLYLTGLARHHRLSGVTIEPGRGKDPSYQIERALTLREARSRNREPFDETWVVIDRDETSQPFQHCDALRARLRQGDCLPGYRKQDAWFPRLAPLLEVARERAPRLRERHPDRAEDRFPNPSTLVDLLIDTLLDNAGDAALYKR